MGAMADPPKNTNVVLATNIYIDPGILIMGFMARCKA
jgi:hypothetical protein